MSKIVFKPFTKTAAQLAPGHRLYWAFAQSGTGQRLLGIVSRRVDAPGWDIDNLAGPQAPRSYDHATRNAAARSVAEAGSGGAR